MKVSVRKIASIALLIFLLAVSLPIISACSAQTYYPTYSQCTVNVTTNIPGGTISPGSGTYNFGDYIVFTEYTNLGYAFNGWYLNGVYEGQLSSIPLTMNQSYNLEAVFSKRVVDLTITANPWYGGTIAPGTGVWTYTYGDDVTVNEFASAGFTFSGWYLDGVYLGAGTSIT